MSANPAGRYTRPLTELLTLAFGPHVVIREEFADIPAAGVAIYGSWAARYHGVVGTPPADVEFWSSESRPGRKSMMPRSKRSSGSVSQ